MSSRFKSLLCAATLLATASASPAQGARTIKLPPAATKLDAEFSSIVAVRELSDGRALAADLTENKLVVVDFAAGTATQIGRTGQGPGEYQNPYSLFRLGGDSTLLVERRTSRWHLLSGAQIVATLPADNATYIAMMRQVLGADGRGNLVRTSSFVDNSGPGRGKGPELGSLPESSWVVRVNRRAAQVDTLGRVKAPKSIMSSTTDAAGKVTSISIFRPPFSVGEEIALFDDGWLAVARLDPYRVDWISPDAKITKGAPLPWPRAKIVAKDVETWYGARFMSGNAGSSVEQARATIERAMKEVPDFMPPTVTGGLTPIEDGQLLVRHPQTATLPNNRYDLVDRSGRLRGTIAMEKGETILAISKTWAYVVTTDNDGLQFLSRHPWTARAFAP